MTVSVALSVVMLAGKGTAYLLTNSAAILSDAAESVVHGAATGFAAFSLWYSTRPPDVSHPYGHGRIVYLSVGVEGMLVVAASLAVLYNGVAALLHGSELRNLGWGLAISAGLAAINLVLGLLLVYYGKKHESLILQANGKHVLSDVWTTLAAIVGVGLVLLTGVPILDPIAGIVIGLFIMFSGYSLVRKSLAGIMDELDPQLCSQIIAELNRAVVSGDLADFHHVRCRRLDNDVWVQVHLLFDGNLPLHQAHERATRIEAKLERIVPARQVHVVSHLEPADHEAAHPKGHAREWDPLGKGETV